MTDTIHKTAAAIADDVVREYESSKKNSAFTYIRLARKLHASGVSQVKALEIVNRNFPTEAKAFVAAQNAGHRLPVLFPPKGLSYEQKRALAIKRGCII